MAYKGSPYTWYDDWKKQIRGMKADEARAAAEVPPEIMKEYGRYPNIHRWLGIDLMNLERYDEARESFMEALRRYEEGGVSFGSIPLGAESPDDEMRARIYHDMGLSEFMQGNHAEAERLYRKALDVAEKKGYAGLREWLLNDLGRLYFDQGRYDAALDLYGAALDVSGGRNGYAHASKGLALYRMGNFSGARDHLEAALGAFEDAVRAGKPDVKEGLLLAEASTLNNLARIDLDEGDHDRAWERLSRAEEIYAGAGAPWNDLVPLERRMRLPGLGALHNNSGALYHSLGFNEKAGQEYEAALRLSGLSTAYYNLGLLFAEEGQDERARRLILQALRRDPGMAEARAYMERLDGEKGAGWWDWWFSTPPRRPSMRAARGLRERVWRLPGRGYRWARDNARKGMGSLLILALAAVTFDMISHLLGDEVAGAPAAVNGTAALNATTGIAAAGAISPEVMIVHILVAGLLIFMLILPRLVPPSRGRTEARPLGRGSEVRQRGPL